MDIHIEQVSASQDGALLLVHGGAWDIPDNECDDHLSGLHEAMQVGRQSLNKGEGSLDVVVNVVASMEAHGAFDAGRGSVLNREGYVELDAGVMCAQRRTWGAVAGIQHFQHPVRIAKMIAEEGARQFCFLSTIEAERFAEARGFERVANKTLICARERSRFTRWLAEKKGYHTSHPFLARHDRSPRGTVGCVARDGHGHMAAATSTGGTPFRMPGRIGDSPLPGCGYFADEHGAASATGWGEAIACSVLCHRAVRLVEQGYSPGEAVENVLAVMYDSIKNVDGAGATGGIILVSAQGDGAWGFTTPRMARAAWYGDNEQFMKVG